MAVFTTPFLVLLTTLIFLPYSSSHPSKANYLPASAISAAPALSPHSAVSPSSPPPAPAPAPAFSPDSITPLFPSPGGPELSPSESWLPIIPSSPSSNPDEMAASGPGSLPFGPPGFLRDSAALRVNVPGLWSSVVVTGFLAFGLMQVFY